ncbi:MAG: TetR/AcrR family transcriptional regulator C-terminal domain-containing protein [Mycobacteriales bacterium]
MSRDNGSRGLSVSTIVRTALDLIDEKGIAYASMRSVASSLDVDPMALYRHVQNRGALLDLVVDRIVDELATDPEVLAVPEDGWRDYLARLARGVRRYARAHPRAFPLVATSPAGAAWITPPLRSLRWIESLLSSLAAEGFDAEQIVYTYRSFNSFLLGFLLLETSAMTALSGEAESDADPVDPAADIDRASFPTVHRLAHRLAEDHYDREFEDALVDLLDRVAARVA